MLQQMLRRIVVRQLIKRVDRLRATHTFTVVAVAGGIGKTSTKLAIAQLLGAHRTVQFQDGNYNDLVTVPLVFFGLPQPSLRNPIAWYKTFRAMDRQLTADYPYDVVVLELGTDAPGDMAEFKRYMHADIGVLTAIVPEHMEYFGTMDAVATEELVLADMSRKLLVNADLCDQQYRERITGDIATYGKYDNVDYQLADVAPGGDGLDFSVVRRGSKFVQAAYAGSSLPLLYAATAAVAVADELGMTADQITAAMSRVRPANGRLRRLKGLNGSLIIDDTYNSSPEAAKAALDTLYATGATHKIAILGSMNELGDMTEAAHKQVGSYCDPTQLKQIFTVGTAANTILAQAAEDRGCHVQRCASPYEAGEYARVLLNKDTALLAKGSQNGVFAEEAVRMLLADPADARYLVRQSEEWLNIKQKQFGERPRST